MHNRSIYFWPQISQSITHCFAAIQIQFESVDYPNGFGNDAFDCVFDSIGFFCEDNFKKEIKVQFSRFATIKPPPSDTPGNFVK